MTRYHCPRCGTVRDAEQSPFCRHGDPQLPATRMEAIYDAHPWAPGKIDLEDEMWLLENSS